MARTNTAHSYGSVTKTFHWITALMILTVIPLGLIANDMANQIRAATSPAQEQITRTALLFSLHKTIGIAIFFTAIARIIWALTQPKPHLLNGDKRIEAILAHTIHWLLYGSLLLVPLTGWIHHAATTGFAPIWWPLGQSLPMVPKSDGLAETFATLHLIFEKVLLAAIALHFAGALKHHVIDKDATLRRMLPRQFSGQFSGQSSAAGSEVAHSTALPILAALAIWAAALTTGATLGQFSHSGTTAPTAQLAAVTSDWTVQSGTIALTVQQFGKPVEGQFTDWTAQITFNPDAPTTNKGEVTATISIPSLTLGSVTAQAMGPDFFDSETHPTASFTADILDTDGQYTATGTLTLKGQSLPVTLPFTLTLQGDTATMQGQTTLPRLAFNIGKTMPDGSTLGLEVTVTIALTATR